MKQTWVFLVFCLVHVSRGCDNPPEDCICTSFRLLHCTNRDSFPDTLPEGVDQLYMNNGTIPIIGKLEYPTLRELIVMNCNVGGIIDDAFTHLTNLEVLDLSSNKLNALTSTMFLGLTAVTKLKLNNNNIQTIPSEMFSMFPSLESLNIGFNDQLTLTETTFEKLPANFVEFSCIKCNLQVLPTPQFGNMPALLTLRLNMNTFPRLDSKAFSSLTHLNNLELEGCSIDHIEKDSFAGLDNLKHLDLSDNMLSEIPSDAFELVPTLNTIELNNNKLTSIPSDLLQWENVVNIDLSLNNWVCDCDMTWISHLPPKSRDSAMCFHPSDLAGHPVVNATANLECPSPSDNSSAIALGIAIPVIIICVVLIVYFVYKIIQGRRRKGQRKSVRYSAVYRDTTEAKTEDPPSRPTSEL